MARYIILIRSAYDPDRRPRPAGGQEDRAPHRTLAKTRSEDWKPRILELLAREGPLTFNAASVLLVDKTADIAADTPLEGAFWKLVAESEIEFSTEAPVLFRRVLPRARKVRGARHRLTAPGHPPIATPRSTHPG